MRSSRWGLLLGSAAALSLLVAVRRRRRRGPRLVGVGSTNPCKVLAVQEMVRLYFGRSPRIEAVKAPSGVPEQPLGLAVIAKGAKNRAEAAYMALAQKDALAIGIESGLFTVDSDELYDVCIASIYDGTRHALGLSCAFAIPTDARKAVLEKGMDLSQAANDAGLVDDPLLGQRDGLIAILTNSRVTRKQYTLQALQMAMTAIEHPQWYHL